jgi:hypothetical protein
MQTQDGYKSWGKMGMSTVSGLMESGMMTQLPMKGLEMFLEAKIVSDS